MRSDLIFGALTHVTNRYELCQLASKATRKLHKPNTRLQDTTNEVLDRFKDTIPMDEPNEAVVEHVHVQDRRAASRAASILQEPAACGSKTLSLRFCRRRARRKGISSRKVYWRSFLMGTAFCGRPITTIFRARMTSTFRLRRFASSI